MTAETRTRIRRPAAVTMSCLVIGSLLLAACSSDPEPRKARAQASSSPSATTSTPPPPPEPARLAGRLGAPNGPVYAVKVDNTHNAHPQAGLSKADVIYVEQVEGGVTRLAAVYSSRYPKYVGPVRSGRITDIELLRQYGTVGLFYSGSQNKLADNLHRAKLKLVSYDQDHTGYSRGGSRPQPYDVIGDFKRLRKRAGKVSTPPKMGYTFGPAPTGGKPAKSVSVRYPSAQVDATWNGTRWLISMDGAPDHAAEGGRLGATTFVVQFATVKPSIYHDINGANTPQTLTVGQGRALFFRDGKVYEGRWSRDKQHHVTKYTIGGVPAVFHPGQLWVTLIGKDRPVTVR